MKPEHVQAAIQIWKALEATGLTDVMIREIKELFAKDIGVDLTDLENEVRKVGQKLKDPNQFIVRSEEPIFPPSNPGFPYNKEIHINILSDNQDLLEFGDTIYHSIEKGMFYVQPRMIGSPVPEGYTLLREWTGVL